MHLSFLVSPTPLPPATEPPKIVAKPLAELQFDVLVGSAGINSLHPSAPTGNVSQTFTAFAGPMMDRATQDAFTSAGTEFDRTHDRNVYVERLRKLWDPATFTKHLQGSFTDALTAARTWARTSVTSRHLQSMAISQAADGGWDIQPLAWMHGLDDNGAPFEQNFVGSVGITADPIDDAADLARINVRDTNLRAIVTTNSYFDFSHPTEAH